MDEEARAESDHRLWIALGAGAALIALGLLAFFFFGKGVGAPLAAFDQEGTARFLGEGVKQVSSTAQAEAAKVASTDTGS